jgi:hypothetical protein
MFRLLEDLSKNVKRKDHNTRHVIITWKQIHRWQKASNRELVQKNYDVRSIPTCDRRGLKFNCSNTVLNMSVAWSQREKIGHFVSMCLQTSSRETTFAFLKILKNKLCGNSSKLQYISVQPYDVVFETRWVTSSRLLQSSYSVQIVITIKTFCLFISCSLLQTK